MEKLVLRHDVDMLHQSFGLTDERASEIYEKVQPAIDALAEEESISKILATALEVGDPQTLAEHSFICFVLGSIVESMSNPFAAFLGSNEE